MPRCWTLANTLAGCGRSRPVAARWGQKRKPIAPERCWRERGWWTFQCRSWTTSGDAACLPWPVAEPAKDGQGGRAAWPRRSHRRGHTWTGEGGAPGRLWVSRALRSASGAVPGASAGGVGCGGSWTTKRLCGCAWSLRKAWPQCRAARMGADTRGRGRVVHRRGVCPSRALRSARGAVPGASVGGERGRVVDQKGSADVMDCAGQGGCSQGRVGRGPAHGRGLARAHTHASGGG